MEARHTFAGYRRAFEIFEKYSNGKFDDVNAGHDEIYVTVDPDNVEPEDLKELEELGWRRNPDFEGMAKFV